MNTFSSLWDIETGTSLGTYPSEEEALLIVRELISANGSGYATVLELAREDDQGLFERIELLAGTVAR